ncbi:lysine-specific demethylase 4E-like [Diachasma alloeum]|uniref:lysine-specific demethylase 4E-like n=1 Tax=Diachasma alloeum TaxID=454923 RepID=UPI00073829D3|nr:lysine-specific demethylase 4E-like [Diachasma alloeum]
MARGSTDGNHLKDYDKCSYVLREELVGKDFFDYLSGLRKISESEGFFVVQPPEPWKVSIREQCLQMLTPDLAIDYVTKRIEKVQAGIYTFCLVDETPRTVKYGEYIELLNEQKRVVDNRVQGLVVGSSGYFDSLAGLDIKYAADLSLDIFKEVTGLNFNRLVPLLRALPSAAGERRVEGIHTAMTYIAGSGSSFPIHIEDCNLAALNYQIFGESKNWFIIPPSEFQTFYSVVNRILKTRFPGEQCDYLLRYKFILLSDDFFTRNKLVRTKYVQKAGDLLVLDHSVFHMGTSMGLDINVAVNYAFTNWGQYAKAALAEKACATCSEFPRLVINNQLKIWQKSQIARDLIGHPYDPKYLAEMKRRREEQRRSGVISFGQMTRARQEGAVFTAQQKSSIAKYLANKAVCMNSTQKLWSGYKRWPGRVPCGTSSPDAFKRKIINQIYKPCLTSGETFGLLEEEFQLLRGKLSGHSFA